MQPRYLTKSRFKLALECPAKLYYTNKSEYADQKIDDPFLLALADGGFQVGELAKQYYPDGHEVKTKDYDEALHQTDELLKQKKVVIFEAAFRFNNLFIRADILIKDENKIELVEVKSKSFDPSQDLFYTNKGAIASGWQSYLYDVAFQKYVVNNALPECSVSAYLMMADKTAVCPTDGLNQKFKLVTDKHGRKSVAVSGLKPDDLANWILCKINVDDCCNQIYSETFLDRYCFSEYISYLSEQYQLDQKIVISPSAACGGCEYKASEEDALVGLKSGFHECWKDSLGWKDSDFQEPSIFEIWDFRKKEQYIQDGCIKMAHIQEEDILPESDGKPGLSRTQRQWLQISKGQNNDKTHWIDKDNLRREMESWVYPLHFIDFETTMVAIPFYRGRHPYEGIAFQYSHHVVYEDGSIEHRGQYLNTVPGVFPNYDFIRSLEEQL